MKLPLLLSVSVPIGLPKLLVIGVGVPIANASGVPSPLVSTCAAVTVSGLPSASVSLVSTLPDAGVSSVTGTVSSLANGASLTGLTVIVALAVGEVVPLLSVTLKGISTVPLKLGAGINWILAACAGVSGELSGTATGGVPAKPSSS